MSLPLDAKPGPRGRRALIRLLGTSLGPFLGLIVVFALFAGIEAVQAHRRNRPAVFATTETVQQILRNSSQIAVAALGMTLIIIAGGIDLSAGTALALCATVTAWFFREGFPAFVAVAAGIGTGCATGLLNGLLISSLRVVPFIVTLGTMTIYLGLGLILSGSTPIRAFGLAPDWILELQQAYPPEDQPWRLFATGVWVMFGLALLVGGVLRYSVFGRHVYALGSNEATARLCGIGVTRVRIAVYAIGGIFVGIAGLFQFAFLNGEGDPNSGTGKELQIIAAVVIGGGSLNGGRGSVLGTISGACIMATILLGCVSLDIATSYQKVIVGLIIIAAVALDQARQRRMVSG